MLFKVEEDNKTGEVLCCGVANNITNESYVFTDVPSFILIVYTFYIIPYL